MYTSTTVMRNNFCKLGLAYYSHGTQGTHKSRKIDPTVFSTTMPTALSQALNTRRLFSTLNPVKFSLAFSSTFSKGGSAVSAQSPDSVGVYVREG
jgi:hypothetical protein